MTHFFHASMRITAVMAILCLMLLVLPHTTAQAQVISPHRSATTTGTTPRPKAIVHPNASGGGCSSTVYSGNRTRFVAYLAVSATGD